MTASTAAAGAEATCPACSEPLLPGDRYCESCGHDLLADPAVVRVTCAHCGEQTEVVDGYCSHCGMKQPSPRDHLERSWTAVGAVTDKGRAHHRNEDAMAVVVEAARVIALVCDGTSTSVDSDVASQAAADAAVAVLAASDSDDPAGADLAAAFEAARQAVTAMPFVRRPELDPPTTTYLAGVITNDEAVLSTLGDCRSYWVDENGARQLTADDSWATKAVASGEVATIEEAMAHPDGHAITRWISVDADPTWQPRTVRFDVPGAGRMVLCSDGLWNYTLDPDTLATEIAKAADPDPAIVARHLVEFANQAGGHDNITVVVVDLPLRSDAGEQGEDATDREKGASAA